MLYGGATCKSSSSGACARKHDQESGSNLSEPRLSSSNSIGMLKANVWSWYVFYFTGLILLGDRVIGSIVVLSRGALEWVTWSHHSYIPQTVAFFHHFYWFFFEFSLCEVLEHVKIFKTTSSSSKTDFVKKLLHSWCWRFCWFFF